MPPKRKRATFYVDGEQHEIYAPPWFIPTWKKFKEICKRDGKSTSEVIQIWVDGYVRRKDPGNPQRPITAYTPGHEDEYALMQQDIFKKLRDIAKNYGGYIHWRRIVEELKPILKGKARVEAAENLARRLIKTGIKIIR